MGRRSGLEVHSVCRPMPRNTMTAPNETTVRYIAILITFMARTNRNLAWSLLYRRIRIVRLSYRDFFSVRRTAEHEDHVLEATSVRGQHHPQFGSSDVAVDGS